MMASAFPRLLGDIGGTNARFAWQERPGAALSHAAVCACDDHASLALAIHDYLGMQGKPKPAAAGFGIANPIVGDEVRMTNHHWSFSILALGRSLGLQQLAVINDFTALALALPMLGQEDVRQVGSGTAVPGAALAVLGPGTGLGVSGLVPSGPPPGGGMPVQGEGGHVSLSAMDDREAEVIRYLQVRFGHVSAERALSGPGLVNLYAAICAISGMAPLPHEPSDVLRCALGQSDAQCVAAVDLFCCFLGGVAGNLALTLGARGGVYIGGGIVPRMMAQLERSAFRERFERKGRFEPYLAAIPTFVIDAPVSPALVGVARALDMGGLPGQDFRVRN